MPNAPPGKHETGHRICVQWCSNLAHTIGFAYRTLMTDRHAQGAGARLDERLLTQCA